MTFHKLKKVGFLFWYGSFIAKGQIAIFLLLYGYPIYLHLTFAILQVEISGLTNLIFLPALACKIQFEIH